MNIKELRSQMKAAKAKWTLPASVPDHLELEKLAAEHHLGALPIPAGMMTSCLPRMRAPDGAVIRPWQLGVFPRHRATVKALPKAWDWRNVGGKDWTTPTHDQGACGSCVAFSTLGAVEAHWCLQKGLPNLDPDLSEAALFFGNNRQCNVGDPRYGWFVPSALDYLVAEGACADSCYPYRPVNQTAQIPEGTERTLKIRGYDSTSNTTQMKRWLVEEGPLVTTYTVYSDFFGYWNGGANGVYTRVNNHVEGGHAVLTVGFDDAKSCWICKNSWRPVPGNDGFFRIGYGQCGINSRMYLVQDVYEVITVDEISYNPRTLQIVDEGARGWLLTDGASRMKMFDNKEDARNGMAVARRHTKQGFVGRDNPRSNRIDYITEYWTGTSGLPAMPLTKTDSIAYNPANVVAEDLDAQGWRLKDGNHWMVLAHDLNDALAILRWIERHSRICFIGRGNNRPNRKQYIMTYWE